MATQGDKILDPCARMDKRILRLKKWDEIYDTCQNTIRDNIGIDKDHVYAACTAITTASREVGTIENVLRNLGLLKEGEANYKPIAAIQFVFDDPSAVEALSKARQAIESFNAPK